MKAILWSLLLASSSLPLQAAYDWEQAKKQYDENVRIAARYPFREWEAAAKSGDVAAVKRMLDEGVPGSLQIPWPEDSFTGVPPCEQAIHHATARGHLEVVRLLLDRGADPNAHGGEGDPTPLHLAKDMEIAKLLVSRGADVNARDMDGSQPIHNATIPPYLENHRTEAVEACLALVKFLIQHGADPLAKDEIQTQPLHLAAEYSTAEVVAFFLNLHAAPDAAIHGEAGYYRNGWQPLHFAANRDDADESVKVAELLLRKGASVNAVTAEGESELHLSKTPAMTRLLLEHGAKIDVMSTDVLKRLPIHHFAMQGDVESLKLLLDQGAAIEALTGETDKETALDIAAFWGRTEAVKLLLERGAKVTNHTMENARRFDENPIAIVNLLHERGGIVSAKMFLQFPKDRKALLPLLDRKAKDDLTQSAKPIADAAEAGDLDLVQLLVSLGAKTDRAWHGLMPIHYAVASGNEEMVTYFLSAGQTIDAKGAYRDEDCEPAAIYTNVQPIHMAAGKPEFISFLLKMGAKIDATTGEGWQPIHFAAAFGNAVTLKSLIEAGSDSKAKTPDGKTPLDLAKEHNNSDTSDFLK
jgi:ankyrin